MGASVDITAVGGWQVVTAAGELDVVAAASLLPALSNLVDAGVPAVVVDLSGVSLIDCACIHVLVRTVRDARPLGTDVHVVGAGRRVRRILEIAGAAADLGIDPVTVSREGAGQEVSISRVEAQLAARAALPEDDGRRAMLRDFAVRGCLPLAQRLAGQYRRPHEPGEELAQVAVVGLLKAVDRFDPACGTAFLGFAFPTILGELRRYFRDQTWGVHVPRHLQELRLSMNQMSDRLAQRLGRTPTDRDMAVRLDEPVEEVREAMVAAQGYAPASLSLPVGDRGLQLSDLFGERDRDLDRVDDHESLTPLVAALPERERRALVYRYFGNMTQAQIGAILGVSQMQVSRLLTRAVARLRKSLLAEDLQPIFS